MTALEIKGMKIGEGLPKTIISLMDPTVEETIETIKAGIEVGAVSYTHLDVYKRQPFDRA